MLKTFVWCCVVSGLLGLSSEALAITATVEFAASFADPQHASHESDTLDVSGSFLLSTSSPFMIPGHYDGAVVEGIVLVQGVAYTLSPDSSGFRSVFIINDSDGFHDFFGVVADLVSDEGDTLSVSLQLRDSSSSLFDSTFFPDFPFTASDGDPYVQGDLNGTGVFLVGFLPGAEVAEADPSYINYAIVPLPAGVWLLLSAVAALTTRWSRRI